MENKNIILFLDNVNDLIKRRKKIFTETFFKDKNLLTMSFVEIRNVNKEYYTKWTEEENSLYKDISNLIKPI